MTPNSRITTGCNLRSRVRRDEDLQTNRGELWIQHEHGRAYQELGFISNPSVAELLQLRFYYPLLNDLCATLFCLWTLSYLNMEGMRARRTSRTIVKARE